MTDLSNRLINNNQTFQKTCYFITSIKNHNHNIPMKQEDYNKKQKMNLNRRRLIKNKRNKKKKTKFFSNVLRRFVHASGNLLFLSQQLSRRLHPVGGS